MYVNASKLNHSWRKKIKCKKGANNVHIILCLYSNIQDRSDQGDKSAEDSIINEDSTNKKTLENSFSRDYEKHYFCIYVIIWGEDDEDNKDDEDIEDDKDDEENEDDEEWKSYMWFTDLDFHQWFE